MLQRIDLDHMGCRFGVRRRLCEHGYDGSVSLSHESSECFIGASLEPRASTISWGVVDQRRRSYRVRFFPAASIATALMTRLARVAACLASLSQSMYSLRCE